jgi:hypothetical protein
LTECLRDKVLKFFSSRSDEVQSSFNLLCQQTKEKFDNKDQPCIVRWQLQEIKQNPDETVEEFAERIEDMAAKGYECMSDYFIDPVIIDSFV